MARRFGAQATRRPGWRRIGRRGAAVAAAVAAAGAAAACADWRGARAWAGAGPPAEPPGPGRAPAGAAGAAAAPAAAPRGAGAPGGVEASASAEAGAALEPAAYGALIAEAGRRGDPLAAEDWFAEAWERGVEPDESLYWQLIEAMGEHHAVAAEWFQHAVNGSVAFTPGGYGRLLQAASRAGNFHLAEEVYGSMCANDKAPDQPDMHSLMEAAQVRGAFRAAYRWLVIFRGCGYVESLVEWSYVFQAASVGHRRLLRQEASANARGLQRWSRRFVQKRANEMLYAGLAPDADILVAIRDVLDRESVYNLLKAHGFNAEVILPSHVYDKLVAQRDERERRERERRAAPPASPAAPRRGQSARPPSRRPPPSRGPPPADGGPGPSARPPVAAWPARLS